MDMPWLFWGNLLEESTRFRCRVLHQVLKAEVSLINKKERKGNKAKGQCGKRLKGEHQWQQASHVIGAKGLLTGCRQVAPHRGSMFRSFEVISWPTLMHSFIKKHFEGIIFQMKGSTKRWSDLYQIRANTGTQEPHPYSSGNYVEDGWVFRGQDWSKDLLGILLQLDQAKMDKKLVQCFEIFFNYIHMMAIRNTGSGLKTPWAEIKPTSCDCKQETPACLFLCKLGIATEFLLVVLPDRFFVLNVIIHIKYT